MFDVQLTDSDTGADLTFGAHQVHLLAQVIKELPFSMVLCHLKIRYLLNLLVSSKAVCRSQCRGVLDL